jgi:hypothetical protein
MTRSSDRPIRYLTAIPLGVDGLVTVVGELIEPVVVLSTMLEMLAPALFEVKRNCPVLFTLGCNAIATGCAPVGCDAGVSGDNVPAAAIWNPSTALWMYPTT